MKLVIFSVEEANNLLLEIRPRIQRLVEAKREFDQLQARIDVLSLVAADTGPENPDARELHGLRERRNTLTEQISQGVTAVHRRGCVIKDLDRGLVDFYALSGDQLIFLCWRLGEPEVLHWHALDGGFAQRQRLKQPRLD